MKGNLALTKFFSITRLSKRAELKNIFPNGWRNMNNKEKEELVHEVVKSLQERKLTFLVGAGISMGRQSWLPGWDRR